MASIATPGEPGIAEIGARNRPPSGVPQRSRMISSRMQGEQGHREDADGCRILAEHYLPVAGGNRQQELVGALPPLLGPRADRDRGTNTKDVRQAAIESVESSARLDVLKNSGGRKAAQPTRRRRGRAPQMKRRSRWGRRCATKLRLGDRRRGTCHFMGAISFGHGVTPAAAPGSVLESVHRGCQALARRSSAERAVEAEPAFKIEDHADGQSPPLPGGCGSRRIVFFSPRRRIVSRTSRIWLGSRPLVGSSVSETSGSWSKTCAMPTRCRSPFDSLPMAFPITPSQLALRHDRLDPLRTAAAVSPRASAKSRAGCARRHVGISRPFSGMAQVCGGGQPVRGHVVARDPGRAGGRCQIAGQDLHRGALAGPFGPRKATICPAALGRRRLRWR